MKKLSDLDVYWDTPDQERYFVFFQTHEGTVHRHEKTFTSQRTAEKMVELIQAAVALDDQFTPDLEAHWTYVRTIYGSEAWNQVDENDLMDDEERQVRGV